MLRVLPIALLLTLCVAVPAQAATVKQPHHRPPTTAPVVLGAHTTTTPQCAPVTVAITLFDGRVAKLRGDWC